MSPCLKTTLLDSRIFFWPGRFTISVTVEPYSSLIMQCYRNMFESNKCDGLKRLKLNLRLKEGYQRWLWRILRLLVNVRTIVVQLLSCVWLFATPRTAAHQVPLSSTISQSFLKFMSIESVMVSNHLILCCPLLLLPSVFSSIKVFSNELSLPMKWPKYWHFRETVFPVSIQGWFPLGLIGLISLQFKGTLKVFSSTTIQKHQFFGESAFFSQPYMTTVSKMMSLFFNTLSRFLIILLPRS